MRTKTIILSAACGLLAAAAANADSVYSVNVVGYVNKSFTGGVYAMFNNPLNSTNTLESLFPGLTDADDGSVIYAWNSSKQSYDHYEYISVAGGWLNDQGQDANSAAFAPGKGAWVSWANTKTVTYVGDVLTGSLTVSIPVGWSQIGSQVPLSGSLSSQGLTPGFGDYIYKWAGSYWNSWTYLGSWVADPNNDAANATDEPLVDLGEGFWYNNNNSEITWTRTFTVSQ
jgi:hypothetical protein